ncbi:MAG: TIM barrel protein [Verrucomicrobiaceae bacterium]
MNDGSVKGTRRGFLMGAGAMGLLGGCGQETGEEVVARKGWIKQVIAAWPFFKGAGWTPEELVRQALALGVSGVELFPVENWNLLQGTGLVCAATKSHTFIRGMNNKGHHAECFGALESAMEATSAAGFPNVMTFTGMADTSGEENGSVVDAEEGMRNCIEGYKKMARVAEKLKVTMVIEPLNSRVGEAMMGHPGYQGDHIDYCVEIVKAVGSPGLKVLFDAYHVQIMDGDLIRRIEEHAEVIGHVQIAGNPGRGEIGDDQEINYRGVMKALLTVGYEGYVGHEWIPQGDAVEGLREAIGICDV